MGDNENEDYENENYENDYENENENEDYENEEEEEEEGGGEKKLNTSSMNGGRNVTRKNRKETMEGGAKIPAVGSKAQVWHGTAKHTSGGLRKTDLMKTRKGRIVSKKKHAAGKKALKNLIKSGYKAKKGTFKIFKKK
jgi:hypothetical protein